MGAGGGDAIVPKVIKDAHTSHDKETPIYNSKLELLIITDQDGIFRIVKSNLTF